MLNVFAVMLLALCGLAQAAEPLQNDLPLAYVAQADSAGKDRPLIIFLHGYGGDENDLMSFTGVLPASYNYVSARAPRETGQGGYQWFSQRQDSARYDGVTADLKSSRLLLEQFIEQATRKYHTQASKVYLVGFSQGAMMSYELALRDPQLVAGFAALSGHMLPVLQAELKPDPARKKLAVFIGHGSLDSLIPLKGANDAQAYLQAQGITPQFHAYFGLPHGVNEAEVRDLKAWLAQVIKGS